MNGIGSHRYDGVELAEKFAWVNGTPGMEAVAPAADGVRNMGRTLGEIMDGAGRTMRDLGVSWTGPASDAAGRSTHQIVQNAAHSQNLAENGADRIMDYGRSFEWLRSQVAYDDPENYSLLQRFGDVNGEIASYLWPFGEDHVTIGERNQAHDEAANRAFAQHEANARLAEEGFATAGTDPPPAPGPAGSGPDGEGTTTGSGPGAVPHVATASAAPPAPGAVGTAPGAVPAPAGAASPAPGAAIPAPLPAGAGPAPSGAGTPAGGAVPGAGAAGTGRTGTGPGTAAAGLPGTAGRGARAGADPSQVRSDLGRRFGNDLRSHGLGTPSLPGGTGPAAPYGSTGRYGDPFGRGAAGLGGRTGHGGGYSGEYGGRAAPGVPRGTPAPPGEGFGGRAGAAEPAVTGRPGAGTAGTGLGAGYAPMMGAGGGLRSDGQGHHNRYLLPSSEPFEVDLPYAPPVLGPAEDDGEDAT